MDGPPGSLNASLIGREPQPRGSAWTAAFLCFVILLTMVGNLALILLIFSQRLLRNTSNFFLVSLFMSDLMVGLVVMPPAMLNQLYGRWVLDGAFCSVWFSFDVMCTSASILNLCVISLDRYLLIISPLKYKLRMTSGRAFWLILATWTLAALVSFLPIKMGWHELEFDRHPLNVTRQLEEEQCRLLVSLPYALIASGLTFFLPSAAILFTYCRILLAARKQAIQVASLTNKAAGEPPPQVPHDQSQPTGASDNRKLANKHSRRALKASLTLGVLLGMFFVAWLPFFVCNMAQ
ncbi:5-hydroxytryptamine receptor 6, partial [Python bivittatus]|uniref:5-hydroxytryptamine receptor 6 n=1 Tax=Python bivittatus TaxID=176946 RepID=A0A9F2RFL7_PYTBI